MNSSSCDQILIQTLQDAKGHCDMSFRHCCPHFQPCSEYSFLFWSLSSIFFYSPGKSLCVSGMEKLQPVQTGQAQSESGDSRGCSSELGPGMSASLVTPLQQHSCFSWYAGPAWEKLVFQDLCSACFDAWERSSHLRTVLAWPSAEQELFEHLFVQRKMSRI